MLKIHNTVTKKKEIFRPIESGKIKMYVCGPTVYDEPHIGHARSAYIFEYVKRYLRYRGFKVKFVKNITDIDDKIIDKAREMKARYGFCKADIINLFETSRESTDYDLFETMVIEGIEERGDQGGVRPLMLNLLKERKEHPASVLRIGDAQHVVHDIGLQGKVDPAKIVDPRDLAYLIEQVRRQQGFTHRYLIGKPYLADGFDPRVN